MFFSIYRELYQEAMHAENVLIIKEEIAYQGVSVIIPRRECIQTASRQLKANAKLKRKEE